MNNSVSWAISDAARQALMGCELFQDLDTTQLMEVAALIEERNLGPDELLLTEGEAADHAFVMIDGRGVTQLKVYRGWLSLGLVGPGDASGWSALVGSRVYPASVKALTPMRVARIDSKWLSMLMNLDPGVGYPVLKRLSVVFSRQCQAALESFKTNG